MNRIKVLHIITHLPVGGAQDNTLITIEGLDPSHYEVTLLCGPEGDWVVRAEKISYVRKVYLKSLVRPLHPVNDVIAAVQIFFHIRESKYHIVHTHSSKAGVIGRLAARIARVPVIIHTIHGFPFHDFMHPVTRRFYILLEQLVSKWSDKIITVSKLNLQKAIDLKIAPEKKFCNIYSGINIEKFENIEDPATIKKNLQIDKTCPIVGFVGRLSEQKSPQTLVKAIPQVLKKYPSVQFLFVGDGELRKKTEQLTEKLGITKNVLFLGYREDIPALLSIMDIYVLSSLWEGLGRSLTEAMIMARPVVATAVEGVPELVDHGETGLLVNPQDAQGIANAILFLLEHLKEAKRMAETAQRKVVHLFAAPEMIRQIDFLYQEMMSRE